MRKVVYAFLYTPMLIDISYCIGILLETLLETCVYTKDFPSKPLHFPATCLVMTEAVRLMMLAGGIEVILP